VRNDPLSRETCTNTCVWPDSYACVKLLIHMCDVHCHSHVKHYSFTCEVSLESKTETTTREREKTRGLKWEPETESVGRRETEKEKERSSNALWKEKNSVGAIYVFIESDIHIIKIEIRRVECLVKTKWAWVLNIYRWFEWKTEAVTNRTHWSMQLIIYKITRTSCHTRVSWLIHLCDTTPPHAWRDTSWHTRVSWIIHLCKTPPLAWRDISYTCDLTLDVTFHAHVTSL